jgi:hypothetical protein
VNVRPSSAADARLLLALGLISAAATAQQIALMQVLGWMHWHHFAYMIVALALLGFGVAGTVLSLARERLVRHWQTALPWLLVIATVTIPLGVRLAQVSAFAVDLPLLFFGLGNVWRLVLLCLLLVPPFFCAGLVTGLVLTVHANRPGRFYAASLAGGGLGGLVGLPLVANVTPPRLTAAVAALALAAACCLWPRVSRVGRATIVLATALLAAQWHTPGELRPSQFKPLARILDLPGAHVSTQRPSVHGWIQILTAPALRPAPAVSLQFQGEIPVQSAVFINGLSYGSLLDSAMLANPDWLDATTDAVAFTVLRPARVLLLENGPGGWTAVARRHGATRIAVVEPNRALTNVLAQSEPPLAPEWRLPGVTVVTAHGRAALRRGKEEFDLIRFPSVGALGGTAGLASASEQFLLTREAFTDAWQRLAPGGVIAVTAWMDFPERNPLRLLATVAEALATVGANPRTDLTAIRGWATVTFLARRRADADTPAWGTFCGERSFDPLLLPDLKRAEREMNHTWQNPAFFTQVDALVTGPRDTLYATYEFLLRPATDGRPYFSQFLRWSGWERIRETFGARTMPFFELGSWIVALTFLVLIALAMAGIILPLVQLGWRAPGKVGVLLYFGGLGAGYMFAEIGLMLRAQALLGSPVLANAIVITSLLIASGIGSLVSDRLAATRRVRLSTLATVSAGLLLASLLLKLLTPLARTWPAAASTVLLLAIVLGLGGILGIAFPLGLRAVEATRRDHLPWAWAVNGCVSVATPAGAMLLAMNSGFAALFAAAAVAYLIALAGTILSAGPATP